MSYLARKTAMMSHLWAFGFFSFLFLFSLPAQASISEALKAVSQGQWQTAYSQAARTQSNEARILFNWYAIINGDPNLSFTQVADFINKHPDFPSQYGLKKRAEDIMPSGYTPASIVQWFDKHAPVTADGMMRYVSALITLRQQTKAKNILNEWWKTASLSREAQREFYAQFRNLLSRTAHQERLRYLIWNNQYSNAAGIAGILEGYYPKLLETRQALRQSKANANSLLASLPAAALNDEGLLFDRLQYRRKKDLNRGAIEILNKAPKAAQMHHPKSWWRERHIIVRRLIEQGRFSEAYKLAAAHRQVEGFPLSQAEWVSGWLALQYINETWKAFEHFEKLYNNVESPISRARGAYWAGKASAKLGHGDIAQQWFKVAAQYPNVFYGQLAYKELGNSLRLAFPKLPSGQSNNAIEAGIFGKGVAWFSQAGLHDTAERFIRHLTDTAKTEGDYIAVARLAKKYDYTNLSIAAAQKLERELGVTSIPYLYPTLPNVEQYSNGLEVAAVHAIIRQESRFEQNAVSRADARGLMQLLPSTAKETARKLGVGHQTIWLTTKPYHNIRLGSQFLKQMIDRYDGHYYLAAAAYNAGPGRVDRWLREIGDPRTGRISSVDWIERIPIYETRNYAQRVSEAIEVYRLINPSPQKSGKTHM